MLSRIYYYTFIYIFVLLYNNLYGCCCFKKDNDPQVVFPAINIYGYEVCGNTNSSINNINTRYNKLKPSSRVKIINIINEYQNNKHFAYFLECFKNGMYEDAEQMLHVMLASNIEYEDCAAFFVIDVFDKIYKSIKNAGITSTSLMPIFISQDMYTDIDELKKEYNSTGVSDTIKNVENELRNEFKGLFDTVYLDMHSFVLRIFKRIAMDQAQKQKILQSKTIAQFIIQNGIKDNDIKILHDNLMKYNDTNNKATNNL